MKVSLAAGAMADQQSALKARLAAVAGVTHLWGQVAYVASVDRDGSGNLAGYTAWEMTFEGPFIANAQHIAWSGLNALVVFMSPPNPVDPAAAEAAKFGPR